MVAPIHATGTRDRTSAKAPAPTMVTGAALRPCPEEGSIELCPAITIPAA